MKKGAGDNDAQRAMLQAEEQDRPMGPWVGVWLSSLEDASTILADGRGVTPMGSHFGW